MPFWRLDKPTKDSAIWEGPTSYVPQRGRNGKLHESCTVHEGFNSDCMESCRKEDFSETSAVHKGEFRNFLNMGVAKVYSLKQSATVACMRSESYKMHWESKCSDFCGAKAARRQLTDPSLQY